MNEHNKLIDDKLEDIINKRQLELSEDGILESNDLLSLLVEANNQEKGILTKQELKSNAAIFALAGHETTSTLLQWITYELAKHPEIQERARREVDKVLENQRKPNYDDYGNLNYINAIIAETLRYHPPVAGVVKTAKKDVQIAEEQHKIVISNNLFIKKEEGIVTTTSTYYEISIDDINISLIEKNMWIIKKDNIFLLRLINNIHFNCLDYTQQEFTSKDDLLQELYNYLSIHKETTHLNNNYLIKAIKLKEIVTLTTNKERYTCLNNNNITLDICKTNICDFYFTYAALKVKLTENECQQIESNNIPIIRNLFENNFKCPGRSAVIEWLRLAKPNIYNNLQIVNRNENLIKCYTSKKDYEEEEKTIDVDDDLDYYYDSCPIVTFDNEEDDKKHTQYLMIQKKIIEERRRYYLGDAVERLCSLEETIKAANPIDIDKGDDDLDYY
ncbi:hypothetical protein ABK040_009706 [Willaertia magna]